MTDDLTRHILLLEAEGRVTRTFRRLDPDRQGPASGIGQVVNRREIDELIEAVAVGGLAPREPGPLTAPGPSFVENRM